MEITLTHKSLAFWISYKQRYNETELFSYSCMMIFARTDCYKHNQSSSNLKLRQATTQNHTQFSLFPSTHILAFKSHALLLVSLTPLLHQSPWALLFQEEHWMLPIAWPEKVVTAFFLQAVSKNVLSLSWFRNPSRILPTDKGLSPRGSSCEQVSEHHGPRTRWSLSWASHNKILLNLN